jgi:hypothetical protein
VNDLEVLHQPVAGGPWFLHPNQLAFRRKAIHQNNLFGLVGGMLYADRHVIVKFEYPRGVIRYVLLKDRAATDYGAMSALHPAAVRGGGRGGATIGRIGGRTGSLQGWPIVMEQVSNRFIVYGRGVELFHPVVDYNRAGTHKIYDGQILKVWEWAPNNRPGPADAAALEAIPPTGESPHPAIGAGK